MINCFSFAKKYSLCAISVALFVCVLPTSAWSQGFEVRDQCNESEFPHPSGDKRSLISGTTGCSFELLLHQDWIFAPIVYGKVKDAAPLPFVWDSHEIIEKRIIGFFARHVTSGQQFYLKIPPDMQQPQEEFIYFESAGKIYFTCNLSGNVRLAAWTVGKKAQFSDDTMIDDVRPRKLPEELNDYSDCTQILGRWFCNITAPDLLKIKVCRAASGGFFVVSIVGGYCGQINESGEEWLWKKEFNSNDEIILPDGLEALNRFLFLAVSRAETKLCEATSSGIRILHSVPSVHSRGMSLSPDQRSAIIGYNTLNRQLPFHELFRTLIFDVENRKVNNDITTPKIINAISNDGFLVERHSQINVLQIKSDVVSERHVIQSFTILKRIATEADSVEAEK